MSLADGLKYPVFYRSYFKEHKHEKGAYRGRINAETI